MIPDRLMDVLQLRRPACGVRLGRIAKLHGLVLHLLSLHPLVLCLAKSARNLQVSELEAVAVKAVLDGYNAGISENLGRILGVWREQ